MPITELLERNAHEYCHETALVEINPEVKEVRRVTWKEYELIESSAARYRGVSLTRRRTAAPIYF